MPPRRFALTLAAVLLLSPWSCASAVEWTAYDTAQLDGMITQWLGSAPKRRAPALSIAVGINGQLVFARGYGEARPGQPADEHTVYHIGSLSKQFTAAAVLRLVEEGATSPHRDTPITLSSPVQELLPGFDAWGHANNSSPVTVRRLLTMTSGIQNLLHHPPAGSDPWGHITAAQMLNGLRRLPPSTHPRGFVYDNFNYFLLAQIVEAAAEQRKAQSFAAFVSTTMISPLDLNDTGFTSELDTGRNLRMATPSWGKTSPYLRRPAFMLSEWLKGSADMASSAVDLFRWNRAIMENRVVSPSSRNLMFSNAARVTISKYYGMGWFVEHNAGWDWRSHAGYVPGFTASNAIVSNSRDGSWISVSLLANADDVRGLEDLSADIVRAAKRRVPVAMLPAERTPTFSCPRAGHAMAMPVRVPPRLASR
ncbi:MAG TPA: serine hydrolase domain-containing protein [Hyphomicrobium sp.]|nr:serine hydrolase domain-containing protein [Hyphomicrobium sp.]